MLFADGTVGPNPYGADPKNRMPYQAQPASVNVTVNVSREEVKVDKPVEDAPAPAEAPAEENKEKLNNLIKEEIGKPLAKFVLQEVFVTNLFVIQYFV